MSFEFKATQLSFAGLRSTRPRTEKARAVVIHWTGGVRDHRGVYETLRARKRPSTPDGLSIHFVVDPDGGVVQLAPLSLVCLHAGEANDWSVGVEVVCPGLAGSSQAFLERQRGVQREVYEDRVRGRRSVRMAAFTEAQSDAVTELCEHLCAKLGIARAVPTEADGSLVRRQMTAVELAAFSGVLGHYHCHPSKLDPGTRPLERLRVRWA